MPHGRIQRFATAADHIVAHPTSITGGIGVIWNSYNLRDLMALMNIIPQSVKSGQNIDMGSSSRSLTPETRKMLQQIADEFHERFKCIVIQSRTKINPNDESLFDGQVMTATKAQTAGLIDSIGYVDDAINVARHLTKAPGARAVMYHRRNDPAHSPYAISASVSPMAPWLPAAFPGLDRSRLPTFLYLWQPEPTLDNR
ncbi:MAG: S49 family peptidase [Planctomycetes bacterium]|nr:S49 family peptidase [Planctomycetota bacterium]